MDAAMVGTSDVHATNRGPFKPVITADGATSPLAVIGKKFKLFPLRFATTSVLVSLQTATPRGLTNSGAFPLIILAETVLPLADVGQVLMEFVPKSATLTSLFATNNCEVSPKLGAVVFVITRKAGTSPDAVRENTRIDAGEFAATYNSSPETKTPRDCANPVLAPTMVRVGD